MARSVVIMAGCAVVTARLLAQSPVTDAQRLFAPGVISTADDESHPAFTLRR